MDRGCSRQIQEILVQSRDIHQEKWFGKMEVVLYMGTQHGLDPLQATILKVLNYLLHLKHSNLSLSFTKVHLAHSQCSHLPCSCASLFPPDDIEIPQGSATYLTTGQKTCLCLGLHHCPLETHGDSFWTPFRMLLSSSHSEDGYSSCYRFGWENEWVPRIYGWPPYAVFHRDMVMLKAHTRSFAKLVWIPSESFT